MALLLARFSLFGNRRCFFFSCGFWAFLYAAASGAPGCRPADAGLIEAESNLFGDLVSVVRRVESIEFDSQVELCHESIPKCGLGLIRCAVTSYFLLAPCASVEFRNVGQGKKRLRVRLFYLACINDRQDRSSTT